MWMSSRWMETFSLQDHQISVLGSGILDSAMPVSEYSIRTNVVSVQSNLCLKM